MSDFGTIEVERLDGVMTITLTRPSALNAFNVQMLRDLIAAFDLADADDSVGAVVVTGAGARVFCAGADLSVGAALFDTATAPDWSGAGSPVAADGTIDWTHAGVRDGGGILTLRIFQCTKPVIAAINGAAVGVGATMTLPMDFRLMTHEARLGFVFARRGVVPEAASSWFLPRLVGIQTALEWSYTGRMVDAQEAHCAGFARSVVDADDLLPAAYELARSILADTSAVSIALTRAMMWRMLGAAHPMEAHRLDSRLFLSRARAPDAAEGVAAFLEKRPANFSGSVSAEFGALSSWFEDPAY